MVSDWSRAEELTQDTFLQVYRKLQSFRFESAFSTWVHRIAVNIVLMHLRQNRALTHEVAYESSVGDDADSMFTYESIGRCDERLDHAVDRVTLEKLEEGFWRAQIHFGFMERPDVPAALALVKQPGLRLAPSRPQPWPAGQHWLLAVQVPEQHLPPQQLSNAPH